MKNILIAILFLTALSIISCGKDSPKPTSTSTSACEQGGEEVVFP